MDSQYIAILSPVNEIPTGESYFVRTGERTFHPNRWTGGAWREDEQHFAPIGGLVTHAIERHAAGSGLVLSRISFDILGVLRREEMDVEVRTIRPGRTIELVEATVTIGGRAAVVARAWRLAPGDTGHVAGGAEGQMPAPDAVAPWPMHELWDGDYIGSLDVRAVQPPVPGRGTAWVRSDLTLVAGEQISPVARFIGFVDTANGIAVRRSPREWMYPNVDLTIHLHRQPTGEWVGLDTSVTFGPDGHGLTSTVLHDEQGPVGTAQQSLTLRPLTGD
jgi:hypothetical protein